MAPFANIPLCLGRAASRALTPDRVGPSCRGIFSFKKKEGKEKERRETEGAKITKARSV